MSEPSKYPDDYNDNNNSKMARKEAKANDASMGGRAQAARSETTSTDLDEATLESRIALKVVRMRMEHTAEQDDHAAVRKETALLVDESVTETTLATTTEGMDSSTPGAVRVEGIHARSRDDDDDFDLEFQQPQPSMPFEPATPIEATLVHGGESTCFRSSTELTTFVEAEPMQEGQVQIKDVVGNRRMCALLIACICIIVFGTVAITLGLVLMRSKVGMATHDSDSQDDDTFIGNNTKPLLPPFIQGLDPDIVDQMTMDPSGPFARANDWMWSDPNLEQLPPGRQLARFSLAALYYAVDGTNWTHQDGWLDYNRHECSWYSSHPQQVCDQDETLVVLNLSSNALRGAITGDLSLYLQIHTLDLSNNFLTRMPASAFTRRTPLTYIDVSRNLIEGYIGLAVGWRNEQLKVIRASQNQLLGNIEYMLNSIPNIVELDLSHNQFRGSLPYDILDTNSSSLQILNLANNGFSGALPSSLASLVSLEVLDVSSNTALSGTIPTELVRLSMLKYLDVDDTSLTGTIPEELCVDSIDLRADWEHLQCVGHEET